MPRTSKKCSNGKIKDGKCKCNYPFTGINCDRIQCVHGTRSSNPVTVKPNDALSVVDPCDCVSGYTGTLCEDVNYDRCKNGGYFADGVCHCLNAFDGEFCEKIRLPCHSGLELNGVCMCHKYYDGDHCNILQCPHGTPVTEWDPVDDRCICPENFKGQFCDACAFSPPRYLPYPDCSFNYAEYGVATSTVIISIVTGVVALIALIACIYWKPLPTLADEGNKEVLREVSRTNRARTGRRADTVRELLSQRDEQLQKQQATEQETAVDIC